MLLLLVDSGVTVFPPLPPLLPLRDLPAGGGGRKRGAAPALRASAVARPAIASIARTRTPEGPREC
jgi:hypothetical protein